MFGWLLVTSGIGVVYRPAREGRKMAYLTLVSFVFLVIALSSVLWHGTQHGGVRTQGATSSAGRWEGTARGGPAARGRATSARGGGA
jgi:hypothetical protein